jgi:2-keto-4-pentenoate hydratase
MEFNMTTRFAEAAEALVAAHEGGGPLLDGMPAGIVIGTLEQAYQLQDAIMARYAGVGGWKVMAGGPPGDPLCSPLPASRFYESGASLNTSGLRIFLAEVEVAVRLNRDFPKRDAPYTRGEIEARIGSFHPALELISSPFVDRTQVSKLALLGDLQSNGAVVVGPAVTDWTGLPFDRLPARLSFDGVEIGSSSTGASFDQIIDALTWLANHALVRGLSLKSGNIVITGSRLLHNSTGATRLSASLGDLGSVSVALD